jgi:hypothetical protein
MSRVRPHLAWSVWSIAMAQVLAGFVLAVLSRLEFHQIVDTYLLTLAMNALAYGSVGLLIATRRPAHRMGWLFLAVSLTSGLPIIAGQYSRYALLVEPDSPSLPLVGWLFRWVWLTSYPIAAWIVLLFPDGRLLSPRWRVVGAIAFAATGVAMLARAFSPNPTPRLTEVATQYALAGAGWLESVFLVGFGCVLSAVVGALASLIVRVRRSRGIEREQVKSFLFATALLLVGATAAPAAVALFRSDLAGDPLAYTEPLFTTLPAIAAGVAILRYQLDEIDRLINRAVVYGAVTTILALVYWTGVALLQNACSATHWRFRPCDREQHATGCGTLSASPSSHSGSGGPTFLSAQVRHQAHPRGIQRAPTRARGPAQHVERAGGG